MDKLSAVVSGISDSQLVRTPAFTDSNKAAAPGPAAATAVPESAAQASPVREPSAAEVKQAAKQLENLMANMNRYLEFRIDQDSGRTVVTVKEKSTGATVRQIPAEEVLRLAQNLGGKSGNALLSLTA